nr:MAG TPA: hypothetical protein [Bacteriophage sp.]
MLFCYCPYVGERGVTPCWKNFCPRPFPNEKHDAKGLVAEP